MNLNVQQAKISTANNNLLFHWGNVGFFWRVNLFVVKSKFKKQTFQLESRGHKVSAEKICGICLTVRKNCFLRSELICD